MGFDEKLTPLDLWQCLMQYDKYIDFKYCVINKEADRRYEKMKPIDIRLSTPPKIERVDDFDTSIDPELLKQLKKKYVVRL